MDTDKWPQQDGGVMQVKPMEQINPKNSSTIGVACSPKPALEKRAVKPPNKDQALNCPRCNSTNTKFCYYNNYSLTQPRYFCKTCRRYWTEGGSLRNVPVGGGSRKNKRSITLSSSPMGTAASSSSFLKVPDLNPAASLSHFTLHHNPRINGNLHGGGQDLQLSTYLGLSQFVHNGPKVEPSTNQQHHNSSTSTTSPNNSTGLPAAMELLRSTGISSRGLNSFMPLQNNGTIYSPSGISFAVPPDFRPATNFSPLDHQGLGHRFGVQENGAGRLLFPFGDMKQIPGDTTNAGGLADESKGQGNANGWWNTTTGMLGGGSW